jgi:hypothetical protein
MPQCITVHFQTTRRNVKARLPKYNARELCANFDPSSYDVMSFVDSVRTQNYEDALKRKAAGAVVLDIGTGGNATLAIAALKAGASFVLAFEINKDAVRAAAKAIRKHLGVDADRRTSTTSAVVLKLPEIWLVSGDATQTCSNKEVKRKLREVSTTRNVIIAHELLDDFATGEDVAGIVGSVQQSLKSVFGAKFLPWSVPNRACTVACPLSVEAGLSIELSGQMTFSSCAIFTHDDLPTHWYHGKPQALESIEFEPSGREMTGDVCAIDCGNPVRFSFTRPVHAMALNLTIDFGSGCVYDVRKEETSNWRSVIIGIPNSLQLGVRGSFSVQMDVFRSQDLQMAYTFKFINLQTKNVGQVHIDQRDLISVMM